MDNSKLVAEDAGGNEKKLQAGKKCHCLQAKRSLLLACEQKTLTAVSENARFLRSELLSLDADVDDGSGGANENGKMWCFRQNT